MIQYIKTPTIEDQKQVLQVLEDQGYRWVDGVSPPNELHRPKLLL